MATSLPWSVKGVDPRTRDAAKAAARRAGMTLGEWLDHKIRDESDDGAPKTTAVPEQLDIAALSERLARLSQGQMDTAPAIAPKPDTPDLSRGQIDAVISQAAATERLTRESSQRTANALDSIARWIEKTETRIVSGERAAAERQERATTVIADAIKTMGERLVDMERKTAEAERKPVEASRPILNRGGLAAAVTDIRTRQRLLDTSEEATPTQPKAGPESRIAALRQDLRTLSARIVPASEPAASEVRPNPIESMIAELGAKLDRIDRRDRLEPVLQPLARIESDISRLSQDRPAENFQRFELELAHLAAKVDALVARGGNREMLAPVLRDIGELRDMLAAQSGQGRFDDLSHQVAQLSSDIGRLRDSQPDGREMRNLSLAIEDVREALLSDRSNARGPDPAPLAQLSRQIEALAGKVEALPLMAPETLNAQADQLVARLADMDSSGRAVSDALNQRIETLVAKLDALADRQPSHVEDKIDALQKRMETLADQGPAAVTKQIEALAGRIEGLAASSNLTQLVNGGGKVQVAKVDLGPVEEMLRKLADKIDDAGRPGAESDSFDALEQQIAGLASRLDEAVATRSAESSMERTLRDLVVHLQTLREDTTAAAERAARAAVDDAGERSGPAGGFAELSTLVSGLRDTHASSGRETQDAIGAVHQTLETVISRLASLETELAAERRPAAAEPTSMPRVAQSRPAVMPAAIIPERIAAEPTMTAGASSDEGVVVERRVRAEPTGPIPGQLDMPLEPGSGRPRTDGVAIMPPDQQSIRQNLIAAARRSAKAATDAAAVTPAASLEPGKAGGRLKDIMEKRRRPLLLALAAIVLAMGTAHVVTTVIKGDAPSAGGSPIQAPAPAIPEAPASDGPAKDKSSSLPATLAIAGPAQAAVTLPEITGSAAAPQASLAALPPSISTEPVQAVTGLGELPAALGTAGLRKAALSGDARAVYELASRAADSQGAARDPKLAMRLFERAAVAGLAPAQFRVGNMFEKGVGTARDIPLARIWYTRAAERGNAKAMHNLAVLHAEGISGKPDYAMATEWFRRAAEFGVRDSQYNLAILLGRGLGAPADLGQSYQWFAIAAGQGDEDAARKRDEVALRLSPADLASAKLAAEGWKPRNLEAAGNEVAAPARGWDETPNAADRKPAKPTRG